MHKVPTKLVLGIILYGLSLTPLSASMVDVSYTLKSLGNQRWQYTYTITNSSLLPPIKFLTIYFPYGAIELASQTPAPLLLGFDENFVDSNWSPNGKALPFEGYYDICTDFSQIGPYMKASGFSVRFKWQGDGDPGSQFFEVFDPQTFEVLTNGWTVPEPSMMMMLGCGVSFWSACRRRH